MIDALIRDDFKTVDKRDGLGSIVGYMAGETDDVPVVLDREKPFGVLNEKAFMKSRLSGNQKIDAYVIGTRTLTAESSIEEAMDVIATSRIPHVPVTGADGRVVGIVRALDVLRETQADAVAERLMTAVPVLRLSTTVGEAMHHLHEVSAGVLPVAGDDGRLAGVVRRRDLMRLATDARPSGRKAAAGNVDDPRAEPIEGYVDGGFETVRPDAPLAEVREALGRVGDAVVVDRGTGRPLGVVTPEGAVANLAETFRKRR